MISRLLAMLLATVSLTLAAAPSAGAQPRGQGWRAQGMQRGWGGMGGAARFGRGPGFAGPYGGRIGDGRFGGRGYGAGGYLPPRYRQPGYAAPPRAWRGGYPPAYVAPQAYPPPQAYPAPRGYLPPRAFGAPAASFDGDWRAQQDEVRRAVREGRHIPLNQAIEAVRRRAPGHELDAGLETGRDGRSVYRLRWAGQNGRRQDYLVDAGTGAVLGVQGGP